MAWPYRILYGNNSRLDEHEYNLKHLALIDASCTGRKGVFRLFQASHPCCSPLSTLFTQQSFPLLILPLAFPKGALLRLLSHCCDDGLFQSFHNLLFGLVGLNATVSQSRVRGSLLTCLKLELSVSTWGVFLDWILGTVLGYAFAPQSLLTFYRTINSNYYTIIRLSVLQIVIQYQPVTFWSCFVFKKVMTLN